MTDTITLIGTVATDPRLVTTEAGLDISSFRLASTQRRFDRSRDQWVDGDTNWYTVTAFRALAASIGQCVHKGDRVVVAGRLRIRPWETSDKSGTTVEVDADAVGHDLRWGRSAWTRSTTSASAPSGGAANDAPAAPDPQAGPPSAPGHGWSVGPGQHGDEPDGEAGLAPGPTSGEPDDGERAPAVDPGPADAVADPPF